MSYLTSANAYATMRRRDMMDWGVILLGLGDIVGIAGRLQASCIEDFAAHELANISSGEALFDVMASLALDSGISSVILREQVENICSMRVPDLDVSKRKWRLIALEYLLAELGPDPLYGLMELSGFWAAHEWPADAPSSMSGKHMPVSSETYHSKAHFDEVINDHQLWLQRERVYLMLQPA